MQYRYTGARLVISFDYFVITYYESNNYIKSVVIMQFNLELYIQ